jgi:hypothetical protein
MNDDPDCHQTWPLPFHRDKMSNPYKEPSIDASYQASVHLAKRFQRRRFKKIANQKQEIRSIYERSSIEIALFVLIQ